MGYPVLPGRPDPKLLDQALKLARQLAGSTSATIPAFIDAPAVKISAKNANISTGSEVSVSGWGLSGASFFGSGMAAGGAKHGFGGSRAGLGGFPTESTTPAGSAAATTAAAGSADPSTSTRARSRAVARCTPTVVSRARSA